MDYIIEKDAIYLKNDEGFVVSEMIFPEILDGVINPNHTYVDESLRNQGIASQMILKMIDYAKENDKKIFPTCPFVVNWFNDHTEYKELIV